MDSENPILKTLATKGGEQLKKYMQFNRVNRTQAENVYVVVENKEGATITTGLPVSYAPATSNDGVQATIANAAADYPAFIGFAVRDIPANDFGRVQVGGFVASVLVSNAGTSITINAGDPLVPSPAGVYSAAPTYANSGFKFLFASNVPAAVSAASYASGLFKLV